MAELSFGEEEVEEEGKMLIVSSPWRTAKM